MEYDFQIKHFSSINTLNVNELLLVMGSWALALLQSSEFFHSDCMLFLKLKLFFDGCNGWNIAFALLVSMLASHSYIYCCMYG